MDIWKFIMARSRANVPITLIYLSTPCFKNIHIALSRINTSGVMQHLEKNKTKPEFMNNTIISITFRSIGALWSNFYLLRSPHKYIHIAFLTLSIIISNVCRFVAKLTILFSRNNLGDCLIITCLLYTQGLI